MSKLTDLNMSRTQLMVLSFVAAAALGVGGYFYVQSLKRARTDTAGIEGGTAIERPKRPVPECHFTDVTAAAGISFKHEAGFSGQKLLPETMGGGVAILDYDGDGKPDILFVNSCPWPGAANAPKATMKLYRNLGNWKFEDVTVAAGLDVVLYGMGVAVGDIDNDGRPDLFISCVGKHRLFRNVDGKKFQDVTDSAGVGGAGPDLAKLPAADFMKLKTPIPFGSSATFLDYDGDGRLDLFVCHYVTWSPAVDLSIASSLEGGKRAFGRPTEFEAAQCTLYRNVDGKKFEDVSAKAGVLVTSTEGTDTNARQRPVGKALGVIAADVDNDGWPDLLVANDTVRNFFFHNEAGPDSTRVFAEKGLPTGAAYAEGGRARGGMGIDWGEFAAGRSTAIIANFANEPLTCLEKNAGKLFFSDTATVTGLAGPSSVPLKFGTFLFDYDNDGRLDLLVNNGHIEPDIAKIQSSQQYAQSAQLFWNTGDKECYFEVATEKEAGADLFKPMVGRGSAFADFDGDGKLDVLLVANGGEARVLRNNGPKAANHWVRFDLRGDGVKSNRSAIGARVVVEAGGMKYTRQVTGGRSYLSQSELVVSFGLGPIAKVDKVTIDWPGKTAEPESWTTVDVDKVNVLTQGVK